MVKNVFVFGLDDLHRKRLSAIRRPEEYRFRPVLVGRGGEGLRDRRFGGLLAEADAGLTDFDGKVGGIVNWWGFPVSQVHAVLCRKFGTNGPPLQAVARCDHRYWGRILQAQAVRDHVPRFYAFDPFDPGAVKDIPLDFPFVVRPVIANGGGLTLTVADRKELRTALENVRERLGRFAQSLAEAWPRLDPPVGTEHVDGSWCIAETAVPGRRFSVEGYVHDGSARTYGVVDTVTTDDGLAPQRVRYPSMLGGHVKKKAEVASRNVMEHIGYNDAGFQTVWKWDPDADRLWLLDVKCRIEPGHSGLYERVVGCSNLEVPVELAVGNEPDMRGTGIHEVAAQVYVRGAPGTVVDKIPTPGMLDEIEGRHAGTTVRVFAQEGARIPAGTTGAHRRDVLAVIDAGGRDESDVLRRVQAVERELPFKTHVVATASMRD